MEFLFGVAFGTILNLVVDRFGEEQGGPQQTLPRQPGESLREWAQRISNGEK